MEDFHFRMGTVNNLLKQGCGGNEDDWLFYHKHKGFWEIETDGQKVDCPISMWSKDGIHPNAPWGRDKYKHSLRTAFNKGVKLLKKRWN